MAPLFHTGNFQRATLFPLLPSSHGEERGERQLAVVPMTVIYDDNLSGTVFLSVI